MTYSDQARNLNPTMAALVARIIWGVEYSKSRDGTMDFWDRLDDDRKQRCELVVEKIRTGLGSSPTKQSISVKVIEMVFDLIPIIQATDLEKRLLTNLLEIAVSEQ